jgi:hypothetical protein
MNENETCLNFRGGSAEEDFVASDSSITSHEKEGFSKYG